MTSADLDPAAQRALAVRLFNRTWELLEDAERDGAGDREALMTAMASRLHWAGIGTDENLPRGTGWSPTSPAGSGTPTWRSTSPPPRTSGCPRRPRSCPPGWSRPPSRAWPRPRRRRYDEERDAFAADARRVLEAVDDDEDREIVESQLATIPGLAPD